MENKIYESGEDYLEAILRLEKNDDKGVKPIDLARTLNVSKPAVTTAMKQLKNKGYILQESYGDIFLTKTGRKIALEVSILHKLIYEFLIKLGVPNEVAEIDCCKIEHVISKETIEKIEEFLKK